MDPILQKKLWDRGVVDVWLRASQRLWLPIDRTAASGAAWRLCEQLVQTVSQSLLACIAQHSMAGHSVAAPASAEVPVELAARCTACGASSCGQEEESSRKVFKDGPRLDGAAQFNRGHPWPWQGLEPDGLQGPFQPKPFYEHWLRHSPRPPLSGQQSYPIRASKPSDRAEGWVLTSRVPNQSTACYSLNVLENLKTRLETITFTTKNSMTTFWFSVTESWNVFVLSKVSPLPFWVQKNQRIFTRKRDFCPSFSRKYATQSEPHNILWIWTWTFCDALLKENKEKAIFEDWPSIKNESKGWFSVSLTLLTKAQHDLLSRGCRAHALCWAGGGRPVWGWVALKQEKHYFTKQKETKKENFSFKRFHYFKCKIKYPQSNPTKLNVPFEGNSLFLKLSPFLINQ